MIDTQHDAQYLLAHEAPMSEIRACFASREALCGFLAKHYASRYSIGSAKEERDKSASETSAIVQVRWSADAKGIEARHWIDAIFIILLGFFARLCLRTAF